MIVKHPREYVVDKLQYALNPKTIAVVGASRYSTKVGYKVVDGLLTLLMRFSETTNTS